MKNYNTKKVGMWILAIITVAIICTVTICVYSNIEHSRVEDKLQAIVLSDAINVELDNQEHTFKAKDFVKENNYDEKYGEYVLQFSTQQEEYKITADTVKNDNVKLTSYFENYPQITKEYIVNVSVVDTTAPEFTEKVDTITIDKSEHLDVTSKFKATDLSGDVNITVDGTVDANTVGEQTVNIFATDKNGNVAQTEVKIVVNEPEQKQEEKVTETTSSIASTNKYSSKKNSTVSKSTQSTKPSEKKNNSNNTKSSTENKKKEHSSSTSSNSSSSKNNSTTTKKTTCTNNSNHSMPTGNSGKWFNNRNECKEYMSQICDMWSQRKANGEITYEEYVKKCPYGYECWSCSYCGKWTVNFYYD